MLCAYGVNYDWSVGEGVANPNLEVRLRQYAYNQGKLEIERRNVVETLQGDGNSILYYLLE
jgi:hypothetical protein